MKLGVHWIHFFVNCIILWDTSDGLITTNVGIVVRALCFLSIGLFCHEPRRAHFFKWAIPGLSFVYFRSFSNKHYNFYNKSMSSPSSIRRQDSNPRPLELESPPITTSPLWGNLFRRLENVTRYFSGSYHFYRTASVEHTKQSRVMLKQMFARFGSERFQGKLQDMTS